MGKGRSLLLKGRFFECKCSTGGIFAVSSNHIKTRSKEKYQELLGYVNKNKNEECSHYLERSYITLFLHDTANNKEYIYL